MGNGERGRREKQAPVIMIVRLSNHQMCRFLVKYIFTSYINTSTAEDLYSEFTSGDICILSYPVSQV